MDDKNRRKKFDTCFLLLTEYINKGRGFKLYEINKRYLIR